MASLLHRFGGLLGALLVVTPAVAADHQGKRGHDSAPALGLRYSYGLGRFSGDLTDTTARPVHDFQLSFLHLGDRESRFQGFLAIDVLATSAVHRGTAFPFPSGSSLDVLAFLFIPHLCSTHLSPAMMCFGVGQGTFNVNADRDQRDFGTWNYQLLAEVPVSENFTAHLIGKYIGQIEQTVDGAYSKFGLYTASLGLGWYWR